MTTSIIQPEQFPNDFCMFYVTVVQIDLNTSSISLSMIFFQLLSVNKKCHTLFCLHTLFFRSETDVAMDLNPLNSNYNSSSLFLVADSISLSFSSG